MLKQGLYIAENKDSIFDSFVVKMTVKETAKSYIFDLLEFESRYSAAHIEMLFKKSNRCVLRKNKGGHGMRTWGDDNFTLYPYQAGIPYYFRLVK